MTTRRYSFVGVTVLAVVLVTSIVGAQEPVEAPPDGLQNGSDYEVYNRGPLHEAFAAPGTNEPVRAEIIRHEPPEMIDEVPPEQRPDGDNIAWVPGYWEFDEDLEDFLWVSGVWRDVPPGRTWVPGYWAETDEGFQRVAGMWADSDVEQVTYFPEPPQSQEHGPSSPSPGDGYFWVPGSWRYHNTDYRWQPGYWAPHQRDWIWVPACYSYTPRGYVYNPGYWDYQLAYRGLAFAPVYFHNHVHRRPFAPSVALNSWGNLMLHLFVNQRRGGYYFGDYYGSRYSDYGYTPFYSYHRQSGYDPLFVYFNWRFGNDYYDRLDGWHRYFESHDDDRPRRTYREQRQFSGQNRDNRVVLATTVASPLEDVVRSSDRPVAFVSLSGQERDRYVSQARDLQEFTRERVQVESQPEDRETQGRERAGLRIHGHERLSHGRQDGTEAQPRVEAPGRPDQMQGIQPDAADGSRARVPSRHSRDRGSDEERPDTRERRQPGVQPDRGDRPEVREQPDQPERPDVRERPETRGSRDLPRLPGSPAVPGADRGQPERPQPGAGSPDRGRQDRGSTERERPDRGQSADRPERGSSGDQPGRQQPDRGRQDRGSSDRGERPGRGQSDPNKTTPM